MPLDDFTEKIELLINDENRIVTYKILSQELKIHVNKAKQYLMDYFNAQKLKGINLEVYYLLSGFIETDGLSRIRVVIVPEDKLESTKNTFREITSFHIYSIYKGATKDECALYSADFTYIKDKEEQNKFSAIKHPNIEIQPPVLNKIQVDTDTKYVPSKKGPLPPANGNLPLTAKSESKSSIQNGKSPEKGECSKLQAKDSKENKTISEDKKQKSSGTLMSMWQKKEGKTNGVKQEAVKAESKGKEVTKALPKNNIMNMFSKQAVKNSEKPPVSKSFASKDEESHNTAVCNVISKEDSPKSRKPETNKKVPQKRKISNKNSKSSKSKGDDSDSEKEFEPKAKKKHRRICTFDDSDSESEPEEEREKAQRNFFLPEEPIDVIEATPLTDDEEPIPPTPPVIHVKGRVRMWKTVKKTYKDDDGFLVTKTEKELVSASEDEEDPIKVVPAKKEEISNKKNIAVHKKQASLMSFFKQK